MFAKITEPRCAKLCFYIIFAQNELLFMVARKKNLTYDWSLGETYCCSNIVQMFNLISVSPLLCNQHDTESKITDIWFM